VDPCPFVGCLIVDDDNSPSEFAWKISNGSTLAVNTIRGRIWCEPQLAKRVLLGPISDQFAQNYAYQVGGVAIGRDAVGIPVANDYDLTVVFGAGLSNSSLTHLRQSTNCVPVLSKNPVQCQVTGNVIVSQNFMTVDAGGCIVSNPVYAVDPNTQGASTAGACTDNHDVGTATIVIGSVNSHASALAGLMDGLDYNPEHNATMKSFSIACTVDVTPSVAFRQVSYSLMAAND